MSDADAYMALALNNAQGELSPPGDWTVEAARKAAQRVKDVEAPPEWGERREDRSICRRGRPIID
jgi:hypothetical protein